MHDLADAVDVGVRFGVDEAGIAVTGVAADAFGFDGVGDVALEAEGTGKRMIAELDVVVDGLHAGFAGERGKRVGLGVEGFGGVETGEVIVEVAVGGEELFGAGVVGLEVGVGEGPCGRDAAFVMKNAEVFSAQAKEGGAVDLVWPPTK